MTKLEITAFILNVLGVWLTSMQYRICWIINIVAVALYVVIFYQVKLYADAMLQGIFILLQCYGWYSWSNQRMSSPFSVSSIAKTTLLRSIVLGTLSGLVLGFLFHRFTDAALPWLDSLLAAFSLVASFWAAKKYIESWALWCVLDAIYVCVYLSKALYLTSFLYFIFILLALNGWRMWRHKMQNAAGIL